MARRSLPPHVEELLGSTDAFLASRGHARRTLEPGGKRPRTLVELGRRVLPADAARAPLHEQQEIAWAMALSDLARVIALQFPENLFADLDHVGATLRAVVEREGHVALERAIDPLVRIHRAYGRASNIRFRYVHDFLYGFDWARWVARDPATRASIGPFDLVFLEHSERRAGELEALIAVDDATYPRLAPGAYRNPFPFDREPASEARLLASLAADGMVPIAAWTQRPQLVWNRPYASEREARAVQLGLVLPG